MSNDNSIKGLREIMFETLRGVKDGSIDPDKAEAINKTAQTIINSAKVEVEFFKATGQVAPSYDFLQAEGKQTTISNTPTGTKVTSHDGSTGVTSTVHRMR